MADAGIAEGASGNCVAVDAAASWGLNKHNMTAMASQCTALAIMESTARTQPLNNFGL